ncbi:MAG: ATP-dependent RecD-like DNA helicase [Anaerolineae bacterium]
MERITWRADDGFTVIRVTPDGGSATITVVGHLVGVQPGTPLEFVGRWVHHPRFGRQFRVSNFLEKMPVSEDGIRRYLASGALKGVGPATADRIVDRFGVETLRVLDEEPARLEEVRGIGAVTARRIAASWSRPDPARKAMMFLQGQGIGAGTAARIYGEYGDGSVAVVKANPYLLAREVRGIGFRTADLIARRLGLPVDSPDRLDAGVLHALEVMADRGHTVPPREELLDLASSLLAVDATELADCLPRLERTGAAQVVDGRAGLPRLVRAETGIASGVAILLDDEAGALGPFAGAGWEKLLDRVQASLPHPLAPMQRTAVRSALTSKVAVLTGGPGTGKTTTVRAILALARGRGQRVALAAPTGRAAKRLAQACGQKAATIHRLLEFDPGEKTLFRRGPDRPVAADLVVVDEASMIDTMLMHALVRAMAPTAHLLLVGDADQLPSVGPGNVLRDLAASGVVPVVRLETVFRQAAGSHIVVNAHRIHQGLVPRFPKDSRDSFLFRVDDPAAAARMAVDVAARRIPRRFSLDPRADVQVLAPMHRGPAGVAALNDALQETLNPPRPDRGEVSIGGRAIRVGDRVMQTANDYAKAVFNGDQGLVTAVDPQTRDVTVDFDGRPVSYSGRDADALTLSWACSVHKSQGSEFPAVVLVVVPAHYVMLQRNLLYTAATRARQLCVVVGSPKALATAVNNDRPAERHTGLADRLRATAGASGSGGPGDG